jgi:hypothetical protein
MKLGPSKSVTAVECPELQEVAEQKVSCKATLKNGRKADLAIALNDSKYTASYAISSLDPAKFAQDMLKDISAVAKAAVELDCGTETLYVPVGESFTCSVKVPERRMQGSVVFVVEPGSKFTWNLKVAQDPDAPGKKSKRRKGSK